LWIPSEDYGPLRGFVVADIHRFASTDAIRIGVVRYLNSCPLAYRLDESELGVRALYDLPSRLADRLAAGDLDVALIPSIEYFRNPNYTVVSDACVSCDGPVRSVKLYSRKPVEQIRTLALDEGSRTSVALSQILLKERFGLTPERMTLPIGRSASDTSADAIVLIGDRCMLAPEREFVCVWDLGEEWSRWTKLPFVFAMWAARPGVDFDRIERILARARDEGVRHFEEIAVRQSPLIGLSAADCLSYFRDNLVFHLGDCQRRGLELFRSLAVQHKLIRPDVELVFHGTDSAGR
jgi:chorismate dehydratase